jgi:exopolyphosphatase/guanosine-5'-triphosphate,3'-diphosphate pyrophosphatase
MKLASIDIGTNSTRLLIADYQKNKFIPLERKMKITRLGKGLEQKGIILDDSAERTLDTVLDYSGLIKSHNVERYRAVGTSALRKASNSDWLISYIYKNSGIRIDIISGEEEAGLSFCGAVKEMDLKSSFFKKKQSGSVLVVDIGGGSSEFIVGDDSCNLKLIKSIDIGCVSLTEKFIGVAIPDKDSLDSMYSYIEDSLEKVIEKIKSLRPISIIGVAGTITALAAIDLGLKKYDSDRIHRHILSLKRVDEVYKKLCSLSLKSRKNVIGLDPKRADIIIGGTAILLIILKLIKNRYIMASEKDILDGIIYSLIDF